MQARRDPSVLHRQNRRNPARSLAPIGRLVSGSARWRKLALKEKNGSATPYYPKNIALALFPLSTDRDRLTYGHFSGLSFRSPLLTRGARNN